MIRNMIPEQAQEDLRKLAAERLALAAERRAKVANPVTRLKAFVLVNATVDATQVLRGRLLIQAMDAQGDFVADVFIDYRLDAKGTGSTFRFADGTEATSSFGLTSADGGFAVAVDDLVAGDVAGDFTVKATAPDVADPETVYAEFKIKISSRTPKSFLIVERGDPSVPINGAVAVQAKVKLLDQFREPISFGVIQTQLIDPAGTGSLYLYNGAPVRFVQQNAVKEGAGIYGALLVGANAPGEPFYLRVNRYGREPHIDIPYIGVAKK